jgi:hypothetical protein
MAAAKATKERSRKFPQDEFRIPLLDALDQLLTNNHFSTVLPTDQWNFQVSGDQLLITRTRVPEDV